MSNAEQGHLTAHADPEGEAPWAMPLVVRAEKNYLPSHTAVCEAAASAVALLVHHDNTGPGGPWAEAVERWLAGRIRKVVRRARASRWDATAALPHVEVTHDGASVRAFVPGPTDQVPAELARLQVTGLDLADRPLNPELTAEVVTVALTPHVRLSTGKAAAQCGHAAQLAAAAMPADRRATWLRQGAPVRVLHPEQSTWDELCATSPVAVTDAGFTEIAPGTRTALASWSR